MTDPLKKIYDEFASAYDQNRGLFDMTKIIDVFSSFLPEGPDRSL